MACVIRVCIRVMSVFMVSCDGYVGEGWVGGCAVIAVLRIRGILTRGTTAAVSAGL